jgi:lysophospholipase L1-like esterase
MNPVLLPVVAAQGLWVRRRVEVLPEASGATTGTTAGTGALVRLVVVGESTAAGCGAPTHEDAFTGAFARALADRRGCPVTWSVHGRHGATIRRVRHRMLPEVLEVADVAVLLIGVNDVVNRTPTGRWRDDLAAVVDQLTAQAGLVVMAGIPPFEAFPSLPRTLRRYLDGRGRVLDAVAREVCATRPMALWIGSRDLVPAGAVFFARDGFHPSPAGYQRWAQALGDRLAR